MTLAERISSEKVALMLAAGRGGEDSIEGGPGNDDILGGFQSEVITPGDGRDDADGGGGNDYHPGPR